MTNEMKKTNTTNTIFLLVAIFAVSINLRPAITSIGPMLEIIREDLQLSNAQVTLLTAIPVICMGIFATLSPVLNRKYGLSKTVYAMLVLIGVTTFVRGIVPGYWVLIVTAFIVGIAIAVIGPLLSAVIKQHFPTRAASVIGIYSFGMGVGSAASAGITGVFFESTGSYPFALGIWAVLALVGLIAWRMATRNELEVRRVAQKVEEKEKSRSPWKSRKAWLFLLFFGLQSALFFSIVTWLAPIAISSGMSLLKAGSLLGAMMTVQIVLNIVLPLLMDRFPARVFWITLMLVSGIIATLLFWSGVHPLMWAGAVIMGIPLGGLFPVALLLPLDETKTASEANSWTAMMQTGGFIIGGILPLLIALVYDITANHHYTFSIFISAYVLMLVLTMRLKTKSE